MPARAASVAAVAGRTVRVSARRGVSRGAARWRDGEDERFGARRLVEIQRSRLLAAAAKVVAEVGYTDATVARITSRARISRRTFYELFADREECVAAMLEDIALAITVEVNAALAVAARQREVDAAALVWCERLRVGLGAILGFLDREPALAQVCVVQSAQGGPVVLAWREEILAQLTAVVDEGRATSVRGSQRGELTAEGLVGAAQAIVYARLRRGERRPLAGLLGELIAMIVLPYHSPAAAKREQAKCEAAHPRKSTRAPKTSELARDPLDGVKMRLTYRTARVLHGVGSHPRASNSQIADHAGIADPGQVSKLLRRLQRLGLLENETQDATKGVPNQWLLTARGAEVAQSIHVHPVETPSGGPAAQNNNLQEGR